MVDFSAVTKTSLSPLDLLPQPEPREKIANLVLKGLPHGIGGEAAKLLLELREQLNTSSGHEVNVVVFGGGTGLSNIIGGDSRQNSWLERPFEGLKRAFPNTRAVVCVTDNGGSTGEMLKDLDMIAIGDIRHVMLSSIQAARLNYLYQLARNQVQDTVNSLALIFNFRYQGHLTDNDQTFLEIKKEIKSLPQTLSEYLTRLVQLLFTNEVLQRLLTRSHCFGNLLIVAAIYEYIERQYDQHTAILKGLNTLEKALGCSERAVLPCTSTPAQLVVRYVNGVEIPGEHKLETARRGVPIERIHVRYSGAVRVYEEIYQDILQADIIVFAPGSLYSSIIPVLQVPGIVHAIRENTHALKMLVSNIWVQEGETDIAVQDPDRRFYVSDMLASYEENIPGGTIGLFDEVLCVSLSDIPASILQRYAVEGKIPIYLDRSTLLQKGFIPVECDIYSNKLLQDLGIIQHDAFSLARVIRGLYFSRECFVEEHPVRHANVIPTPTADISAVLPCRRYEEIEKIIHALPVSDVSSSSPVTPEKLKEDLINILWDNPVIPLSHLSYFDAIELIDSKDWNRERKWDNVFSYFDPDDFVVRIRSVDLSNRNNIELAFLLAVGESLLGNYAVCKDMRDVFVDGIFLGRAYHLYLRQENERRCYFSQAELTSYLKLARMFSANKEKGYFTRLLNTDEGFTPPGLLMGLTYAWYVNNRLATHIEYKMSVLKVDRSNLIPNQIYMAHRRKRMIDFFREVVFRRN